MPTLGKACTSWPHRRVRGFRRRLNGCAGIPCTLYAERPLDDTHEQAVDRVRFFLSVDDDLVPFYTIGREAPHVLPIQKRLRGSHQVKFLTPFKNACWADLLCHASRYGSHQGATGCTMLKRTGQL